MSTQSNTSDSKPRSSAPWVEECMGGCKVRSCLSKVSAVVAMIGWQIWNWEGVARPEDDEDMSS